MGNREALLAGAKRCLLEKGYARTTARDIAAAAGVSLAAIGYHFGSKEALLNAALFDAIEEWSEEMRRILAADLEPDAEPMERFEATWTRVIESFATHRRLWVASFEMLTQLDRVPAVQEQLAAVMDEARLGLAELFQNIDATTDEKEAWAVGSFYHALLSGMLVQWLVDPARAPTGHDLAEALRTILATVGPVSESGPARSTGGTASDTEPG